MTEWTPEQIALARKAECWTTPEWAVRAILECEILTAAVADPCCGPGIMADVARQYGYECFASDLYDWGTGYVPVNFLEGEYPYDIADGTIFMNAPFSLACAFVERAFELRARKIVCFQRWAWWESARRRDWWHKYPPQRVYVCSDRATCWLVTTPESERLNAEGREKTTPTSHGWFIWERGNPTGPVVGHVSRDMVPG